MATHHPHGSKRDAGWEEVEDDEPTRPAINPQQPGPLLHIAADPYGDFTRLLMLRKGGALGHSPKASEAALGYTRYREADARLLAASYTAFDRAGRALGMDAATLAEDIDVAALIQTLRDALPALQQDERRATIALTSLHRNAFPEARKSFNDDVDRARAVLGSALRVLSTIPPQIVTP